ncbi:MAG TPA: PaaI family thioesterase [Alphaproteobacteria bacterium]|jgi:uncharacterized protein (TIGR00369 family)|nr:PaaI family thioesterase [Alphaproteobacteria bacterium]
MNDAALTVAEANRLLEANFAPWVKALNLAIEECGRDGVTMRMAYSEELCRVGGLISGQALMALADTCMVFVASAALGRWTPVATTNQNTSFLRPAVGRDVIARGRALKAGRSLVFGEVTLTVEGDERPVAHVTSTCAVPASGG